VQEALHSPITVGPLHALEDCHARRGVSLAAVRGVQQKGYRLQSVGDTLGEARHMVSRQQMSLRPTPR